MKILAIDTSSKKASVAILEDLNTLIELNNNDEKTQKEIAKELGISRSYVSRIEKRALTKMLTEFIKNKNID